MPVLIPILRTLRLFDTLPQEELQEFAVSLNERRVGRREVVIKQGEVDTGLGFLVEGRLQAVDFTLDGREVGIHFVDAGDFFGELAVIDRRVAAEYIIAVAPSRLIFVERERARRMMFSTPATSEAVSLRLAQRLRQMARQRALLALPSSFQRVCAQLTLLLPSPAEPETTIEMAPTHQEIAIMVNTSRETVTRALQYLQALRVVMRSGTALVVTNPAALQEAADGKLNPGRD